MNFEEKMQLIYDMLIDGIKLTKDNLIIYGLSEEDLLGLENKNMLSKTKEEHYKIVSVEKFRQYGVKLLIEDLNFSKARRCFEACYKIAPTELKTCYHILIARAKNDDSDGVIEVLGNLKKNKNSSKDIDFITYLLSFLFELPEEDREKVIRFEKENILLSTMPNTSKENKCREYAFNHKFAQAIRFISGLCNKNRGDKEYSPKYRLIKELLNMIDNRIDKFHANLLNLVETKNYQKVVEELEEKRKNRQLSYKEQAILLVAKELLRLASEKVILEPTSDSKTISKCGNWFNMSNILQAIKGKNFKLAYDECIGYMADNKPNNGNNVLYKLLSAWNELHSKLENEACILTFNDMAVPLYELDYSDEDKDIFEVYNVISNGLKNNISLEDIIRGVGFLDSDFKLLAKLIYARYCFYNAKRCYDLAYELFELEDINYYKAVNLFYAHITCGDKLVSEVKRTFNISQKVQSFLDNVEAYKKDTRVSGVCKKLVK